jgi:hypothetical protein
MGHTIKTLGDGAITRKALAILHNKLVFVKSINKEYDDRFARSGAKIGASLLIREPNQFTVRSGAVMDTQDVTETTQTLTVATQKGVDINFSSEELTLHMDDFARRILDPAMSRLAAEIDKICLAAFYKDIYNIHWKSTFGTTPLFADAAIVRSKLSKGLAPTGNRTMLMESLSMNSVVGDVKALYHSASEIAKAYDTGLMGHALGFEFRETEMIPTHTNGSRDDATAACHATAGSVFTSGTATFNINDGSTDGLTLLVGDVFTIAECFAVNPETKEPYGHLQQWVVTEAATLSSATTNVVKVSPTPITSGAKQNISVPAGDDLAGHAVVHQAAGGSGTASQVEPQNLAYHKDAFTFVSADLEVPQGAGVFAKREIHDGISLRIWRGNDIINDKFPCRIDVLFGYKTVRPEWAARLVG